MIKAIKGNDIPSVRVGGRLVVRVAGFCAFFTCLDQENQREIIARTEHAL